MWRNRNRFFKLFLSVTDGIKIFHCELFFSLLMYEWTSVLRRRRAAAAAERSASGRSVQGSGHKKVWQVFSHRRVAICPDSRFFSERGSKVRGGRQHGPSKIGSKKAGPAPRLTVLRRRPPKNKDHSVACLFLRC